MARQRPEIAWKHDDHCIKRPSATPTTWKSSAGQPRYPRSFYVVSNCRKCQPATKPLPCIMMMMMRVPASYEDGLILFYLSNSRQRQIILIRPSTPSQLRFVVLQHCRGQRTRIIPAPWILVASNQHRRPTRPSRAESRVRRGFPRHGSYIHHGVAKRARMCSLC